MRAGVYQWAMVGLNELLVAFNDGLLIVPVLRKSNSDAIVNKKK